MKEKKPFEFEPYEVVIQLRAFSWLLGSMDERSLSSDYAHGLHMIGDLIIDQLEAVLERSPDSEE